MQGMKEYTRQTFGEEALALFGEEEEGGSVTRVSKSVTRGGQYIHKQKKKQKKKKTKNFFFFFYRQNQFGMGYCQQRTSLQIE